MRAIVICAGVLLTLSIHAAPAQTYKSSTGDLAVTTVVGGLANPWALAFLPQSDKYKDLEAEAKAAKRGLWQDGIRFTVPWQWREMDGKDVFGP